MKFVILAKAESTRLPGKNYRAFSGTDSLVDVLIGKLLAVTPPGSIYLSCEENAKRTVAERYGIHFLLRPRRLATPEVSLEATVQGVARQVPLGLGDDLAWCLPTDPLFAEFREVIADWRRVRAAGHDSLVVAYRDDSFLVDEQFEPLGWRTPPLPHSRQLPAKYRLHFPITITTRALAEETGRWIGDRPAWYVSTRRSIDINTAAEFQLARLACALQQEDAACLTV